MKPKIKTVLFTIFLFFGILVSSHAQDKYEFAVIQLHFSAYIDLSVSINGETYEEVLHIKETILKSKYLGYGFIPSLKKINEMQNSVPTTIGTTKVQLV